MCEQRKERLLKEVNDAELEYNEARQKAENAWEYFISNESKESYYEYLKFEKIEKETIGKLHTKREEYRDEFLPEGVRKLKSFYRDLVELERMTQRSMDKIQKEPEKYSRFIDVNEVLDRDRVYLEENSILQDIVKRQLKSDFGYDI